MKTVADICTEARIELIYTLINEYFLCSLSSIQNCIWANLARHKYRKFIYEVKLVRLFGRSIVIDSAYSGNIQRMAYVCPLFYKIIFRLSYSGKL